MPAAGKQLAIVYGYNDAKTVYSTAYSDEQAAQQRQLCNRRRPGLGCRVEDAPKPV